MSYLLVVKASARRTNEVAARWVAEHGPGRAFDSKAEARTWARNVSHPGERVWLQDAVPFDASDADGYLVAGVRRTRCARGTQSTLRC